jgi:hypothetical protein
VLLCASEGAGKCTDCRKAAVYRITVQGLLDQSWADWFDGLAVIPQTNGETLLSGRIADQAALHGLLARIRDLGLPLLSVRRADWEE